MTSVLGVKQSSTRAGSIAGILVLLMLPCVAFIVHAELDNSLEAGSQKYRFSAEGVRPLVLDSAHKLMSVDDFTKLVDSHEDWLLTRNVFEISDGEQLDLSGWTIVQVDLSYRDLSDANLQYVDIAFSTLEGATLIAADLTSARISDCNLKSCNLSRAILVDAKIGQSTLEAARLQDSELHGLEFSEVDVYETIFEPRSLPLVQTLRDVDGVSSLVYESDPTRLVALRAKLREAGLRNIEREVNFAIQHGRRLAMTWWERAAHLVLFEWTCMYGLRPWRPLAILLALTFVFSVQYTVVIIRCPRKSRAGIWATRLEDSIPKKKRTRPIAVRFRVRGQSAKVILGALLNAIALGWYFSLLSTFRVGFRELNIGSWITNLQCRQYTFRSTSWVRFLSGVQSLISVYLLALTILTYFGRPFE